MKTKYQILIVGGGNAGISVAAKLLRRNKELSIAIIEPSDKHYYQPAWTLVGGGIYDAEKTVRTEKSVIPENAEWIKDRVEFIHPDNKELTLSNGIKLQYEYLVVAPGIQLNWNEIEGLKDTLGKNGVCSNYSFEHVNYTWECIRNFKGGNAIFTSPHTPVKCGGAPQKIMYLAADYFRKHHLLDNSNIHFMSGGTRLFGVEKYEKALYKVVNRNNIQLSFHQKLVEIDGARKKARFLGIGAQNKGVETWIDFDILHVTPPQAAPDFLRSSKLLNEAGWVDVDKNTLQHNKYSNVFALGDAAALPTSKTGAAIRKQAPVLVENLLAQMVSKPLTASYNGYTSCPIVTAYGKLILAEFNYANQPEETFPFDQSKERWSMYQLKTKVLPWLYWNKILSGKI